MKHYTKSVITQVLNEDTGELESRRFTEDVSYKKTIRQGWNMIYSRYDGITLAMNSKLETKLMIYIRDKFTRVNTVVNINQKETSVLFETTPSTVNRLVKKLEGLEFIKKVDRGIYRLNPYIYLPYQADGVELQKLWASETAVSLS